MPEDQRPSRKKTIKTALIVIAVGIILILLNRLINAPFILMILGFAIAFGGFMVLMSGIGMPKDE